MIVRLDLNPLTPAIGSPVPKQAPRGSRPGPHCVNQCQSDKVPILLIKSFPCSNVPICASELYKEVSLRDVDMDIVYLNGWVALFQFFFTIPAAVPAGMLRAAKDAHLTTWWCIQQPCINEKPGVRVALRGQREC
jgi:hypothetical protein